VTGKSVALVAHPFDMRLTELRGLRAFLEASEPQTVLLIPALQRTTSATLSALARELVHRDALELASRVDGLVLVGHGTTAHMAEQLQVVRDRGGWISNLTALGRRAPSEPVAGVINRHIVGRWSTEERAEAATIDIFDWLHRDIARRAAGRR
jgi:hypothetical protein